MLQLERHTLVHLSPDGRERIFNEVMALGYGEKSVGEMLLPDRYPGEDGVHAAVPGIVRREEFSPRDGFVPVGFASWRSSENGRLRVGSFARPEEIVATVSPEDVAAKPFRERTPCLAALAHLRGKVDKTPASLGVWGSAAMEIETGHAYTHQWSDLDIRLLVRDRADRMALEDVLALVLKAEKEFGLRIDAELRVPGEYGVSLKELLSGTVTVLAKGLTDVALFEKKDVFAGLAG